MFILLGYASLALVQLYREYCRRGQYSSSMLRALRGGSVLVQQTRRAQHGSIGALLNSSLLSCSRSYKETQLMTDEYLAVSVVSPKQQVDLGEWTSYLYLPPPPNSRDGVVALLEADTPSDRDPQSMAAVPPGHQVHVLKHGCPLAWKYGSPFGILLYCSHRDFVQLCDAFGQGRLTLDGDLQLSRMLTVSTVGKPKSLRRPKSEEAVVASPPRQENIVKTQRANTDPICLLASVDTDTPLFISVASGDAVERRTVASDSGAEEGKMEGDAVQTLEDSKGSTGSMETLSSASQLLVKQDKAGDGDGWSDSMALPESPLLVKTASLEVRLSNQSLSSSVHSTGGETPTSVSRHVQEWVECPSDGETVSSCSWQELDMSRKTGSSSSQQELGVAGEAEVMLSRSLQELQLPKETEAKLNGSLQELELPQEAKLTGTERNSSKRDLDQAKATVLGQTVTGSQQSISGFAEKGPVSAESQQSLSSVQETCSVSTTSEQEFTANAASSTGAHGSQQEPQSTGISIASTSSEKLKGVETSSEHDKKNGIQSSVLTTEESQKLSSVSLNGSDRSSESCSITSTPHSGSTNGADGGSDSKASGKPPNVVVYCGKKDSARKFDIIKKALNQCLNGDAYTIYMLPHEDVMTTPWETNSALLIISYDYLHDNIGKKCAQFLLNGGKVISFGSSVEADFVVRKEMQGRPTMTKFTLGKWRDVFAIQGRYHYVPGGLRKKVNSTMETVVKDPASGFPLVVQLTLSSECGSGKAVFSQLFLERDPSEMASDSKTFSHLKQSNKDRIEVLRHLLSLLQLDTTSSTTQQALTPAYLLAQDQCVKKALLDSLSPRMRQGAIKSRSLTLRFVSAASKSTPTNDTLPVVTDASWEMSKGKGGAGSLQSFDIDLYWRHLGTSEMGRVVLYTEVIPTTMTVFEGIQFSIPSGVGLIAVAGRQTSGKGRGGNAWLSPAGCAMFTLPIQLPLKSCLGERVSFLQHIVSFSLVHGIRSIPGYQDLDLRLKWPNDIYHGNSMKLGGVLVTSTIMDKAVHATVGCGVNVSNSQPTICINSVIEEHNRQRGLNLKPLSTSEVLARTVTTLEQAIAQFQDKGHEDFCQQYYKYWLHSGACVKVESEGNVEMEVCGLDEYGFLHVVSKQGDHLSLQPDGNSFDMLHNLITIKRQ